ncbi:MAG: ATP-binding protein [Roseburia sp.]|nr:ATP-binding protein [Roseburia sp.]
MEENLFATEKLNNRLERIVMTVLTIYTAVAFVTAWFAQWGIYKKEILVVAVIAGWVVTIRKVWNHETRAKFIALMSWINYMVYALSSDDLISTLSVMAGVIVLMAIFYNPQVLYMGLIVPAIVFSYHIFIAKTVEITSLYDALRLIMQLVSIYTVSAVTWIMMRSHREINDALVQNINELKVAEQSKDDFMVNISHEIRTPINAVCGMSEAILQEELPVNVRRDVIDIQAAGRNLLSSVSNILDFSELESGKMELAEESYNITSTITDIINMTLTLENGKNLEFIVDCDSDLPSNLVGDEQKLRRIVINLLDNALKFTKEGGVILRIKGRREEYGMNLIVSVRDSGIGIERSEMETIFSSFSQVDSKRNREEGGVGLGLAITQALVRRMGGFITVNSEPGIGSEFVFTVPQKVLDETPIVSIKNRNHIFALCYINMDKYNYSVVREGYENCIRHISEQFGILFRVCRNLPELRRRIEREKYTHIFIGWEEYCEDRSFFDKLATQITVVLLLEYEQELLVNSNMLRIYKPFTVLSIAAVFNGQKLIQNDEQHMSLHNRFIAPSANVLVVDDNAMNLKVMARLLLPYQIKVTMAGGGQEALEKLDKHTFDCVFLDHMMPEMDGVETLHKIRQKPGTYFQSLSVIAFTANAIGGAREMFLSEGFDDFIAKPIELSVLERMLRRYIPEQKQIIIEEDEKEEGDSQTGEVSKPESAGNTEVREEKTVPEKPKDTSENPSSKSDTKGMAKLTRAGINIEQGISYCGDQEGFREIISIYHKEGANRRKQLADCFEQEDWKNYVINVHALKSNSKGVGANELSEMALKLEMAGKENRIEYILQNHEELMQTHDELLRVLGDNEFVYPEGSRQEEPAGNAGEAVQDEKRQEEPAAAETDEKSLIKILATLEEKLSGFESEGLEDILKNLANCQYSDVPLAELAEQIREKTNEFDFLGAAELLESWRDRLPSDS